MKTKDYSKKPELICTVCGRSTKKTERVKGVGNLCLKHYREYKEKILRLDQERLTDMLHETGHAKAEAEASCEYFSSEIIRLRAELAEWKRKFHDHCDVQLDEFRKIGMVEAAKRCIEIAEPRDKHVAKMLRKEFGLRE